MIPTFDTTQFGFEKIWLWADTHFGHDRVRLKCERPWANIDKMDNALIKNARKVVGENDLLIHVGDITMAGAMKSHYVEALVSRFPGTNVLVYGSHDKLRPRQYLEFGFVLAATSLVLPNGILVTHDPADATVWPDDKPVLCGHVHRLFQVLENVVNVGVDVWDYKPVLMEDALALCSERRGGHDLVYISKNRHKLERMDT